MHIFIKKPYNTALLSISRNLQVNIDHDSVFCSSDIVNTNTSNDSDKSDKTLIDVSITFFSVFLLLNLILVTIYCSFTGTYF